MGAYTNRHRCISCHAYLPYRVVMYSDGTCPECGHTGDAITTVKTYKEVGRWERCGIFGLSVRWIPMTKKESDNAT